MIRTTPDSADEVQRVRQAMREVVTSGEQAKLASRQLLVWKRQGLEGDADTLQWLYLALKAVGSVSGKRLGKAQLYTRLRVAKRYCICLRQCLGMV